ncbi:hypothetical protein [Okeania sp. SIO2B9]|uniref:hypothetical protein n=1 Tax=Microcoleaceae TaxID=1892252 RepID=UPI00142B17E9|nr:hypothetical protein [Okeania sp. SIO2B9]NES88602.1 hypothetical protein [Okeania sp. SIO2B9]
MEWEPFPEELEPICYWTRKQVLSLFESCFQKGSNSLTRDVADIKALIESGEIAIEDCPLQVGSKRNWIYQIEAVRFLWYYRQIVQTYGNRAVAKEYIKKNGVPL